MLTLDTLHRPMIEKAQLIGESKTRLLRSSASQLQQERICGRISLAPSQPCINGVVRA